MSRREDHVEIFVGLVVFAAISLVLFGALWILVELWRWALS